MARLHTFIRLSPKELQELERFLNTVLKERGVRARRRTQAIWFSHQGRSVDWIANHLQVHKSTVWEWLKTYQQKGLEGLKGKYFYRHLRLKHE